VPRLATFIALLCLAFPGAAFAQGAGDDQYQDPFGDQPVQSDGAASQQDGGLSDTPPGGGGSNDSGGGSQGSPGSGSAPSSGAAEEPSAPAPEAGTEADEQVPGQLPNTGADARLLFLLGLTLVLTGVGLRLRTIDPNAY
jgi:LPXTG-motif cell wall-anchored protein